MHIYPFTSDDVGKFTNNHHCSNGRVMGQYNNGHVMGQYNNGRVLKQYTNGQVLKQYINGQCTNGRRIKRMPLDV